MPIFSAGQLIGKTFFVTRPLEFYRVNDVNLLGDKAQPVSNKLKRGYSFVLDSFLLPTESFTKYGTRYAARTNPYFTFYGNDKNYYAVIQKPDGRFSLDKLKEQGAKSDVQIAEEKAEENKTPVDKLTDMFAAGGKTLKTILYIGIGIYAAGYLLPKILKK
jgi:hypothetical protein